MLTGMVFCMDTGNNIGDDGAMAVSEALRNVQRLLMLDLLGTCVCICFWAACVYNLTLYCKGRAGNEIGDRGAQAVAGALASVPLLQTLDFSGTGEGERRRGTSATRTC
jgi:Leucine Rich repeat